MTMTKEENAKLGCFNVDVQLFMNLAKAKPCSNVRIYAGAVWQNMQRIAQFQNTEAAVNTLLKAGYKLTESYGNHLVMTVDKK